MRPFYITTPIYYVNDKPHIGHAYTSLAADVLARWKRMQGFDVFFLTGTDEHGQKVEKAAQDAGEEPQAFVDRVSQTFRDLALAMGFSNDGFIRTTEPRHYAACQALWTRLREAGAIYEGHYEGWYAVRDEAYYGPDELVERDGQKFAPSGAPVEWVREPSWFFRLSAWGERLLAHFDANPEFIAPPSRRNEVIAFIKSGLQDLSISRTSFSWGVPVPNDPAHVMYVWLDALTNYLTAVGYPDENAQDYRFWPADIHFVGKDILRFHAIYWPAFLMAAELPLPKRIFAHGWWTNEGQKISKSLGNVIDPLALIEDYGLDPVRYFLLREVSFGQDGDFSRRALGGRLNSDLANDLGNLAQRSLSLIQRNAEGKLPALVALTEADHLLLDPVAALPGRVAEAIDRQAFHEALERVWEVVRLGNSWIDAQKPWSLKKTDPVRGEAVLRHLHTALRGLATVLLPFMPGSMGMMLDQCGVPEAARGLADLATPLPDGTPLAPPTPIFRKVELTAA
ncbi:methionyl-tRNA synthetase [Humitalea rosea]|uniref:Methionine--tRNA ligase n=1 Tax=Humitalea rosea TaxID=990373 RepID=A0A2W7JG71_9PROT|nr:methionine--tRNA ligase [Humitalea rosea]PZW51073.1 methionyl-tRNA synthetase [Humitalea rosea]